jgi:DNA-binding CsgD family transcriptional regulator
VPAPLAAPVAEIRGGSHQELIAALTGLAAELGCQVVIEDTGRADGYCDLRRRRIAVAERLEPNGRLVALIHELAHALVAADPDARALDYAQGELIAESVAWCCCQTVGLDCSANSIPYLASWAEQASLEVLEQTAQLTGRGERALCGQRIFGVVRVTLGLSGCAQTAVKQTVQIIRQSGGGSGDAPLRLGVAAERGPQRRKRARSHRICDSMGPDKLTIRMPIQIFGREEELAVLGGLLDAADQRGAAVVIRGEAGIGKSFLIQAARRHAEERGFRVVEIDGLEREATLPFAGLHTLLRPILARIRQLPAPQRHALEVAFGHREGKAPELFLIALATLTLISEWTSDCSLLVVVEDAQWLDPATADVLLFVARRLESDPVVMLIAARSEDDIPLVTAGLAEIALSPLDDAAARALLEARWPELAPAVRKQLIVAAAGSPLALTELPRALAPQQLVGGTSLPKVLPLTAQLAHTFLLRVAELPDSTQTALLVAALNDGDSLSEALEAAGQIVGARLSLASLTSAQQCDLVDVEGTALRFRHPLVRSAISQAAAASQRVSAHAALAEIVAQDPDRRAWHLSAASVGPDEDIAALLEVSAHRALDRGNLAAAVSSLERAAELSPDSASRGGRWLSAAELAVELGRVDAVSRLLAHAGKLSLSQHDEGRLAWMREATSPDLRGDPLAIRSNIDLARSLAKSGDVDLALRILAKVAWNAFNLDHAESSAELFLSAIAEMPVADDDPRTLAILAYVAPVRYGPRVIASATSRSATSDPQAMFDLVNALGALGAQVHGEEHFLGSVEYLRSQGMLRLLSQFLLLGAWASFLLGHWRRAEAEVEECLHHAEETRMPPVWNGAARALQATLAGVRGDHDSCGLLAAEAEPAAMVLRSRTLLFLTQSARGLNALSAGRYEEAYHELRRMFEPSDPTHHSFWFAFAIGDLAEAAVAIGRSDDVRYLLHRVTPLIESESPWLLIAVQHARALLADDQHAEALYQAALNSDMSMWPFHRARLQLAYGVWLRRQRRRADSRVPLRRARDTFDALGAIPWGERARSELRASGEGSSARQSYAWYRLTAQELQIARLAADGLSNKKIGERLFLSHRTIGSHLYQIFPKLGIASRRELRDALAGSILDDRAPT